MDDMLRAVKERLNAEVQTGEIKPTHVVPAVSGSGLSPMQWGFPRYDGKGIIINARSETAAVKPMFAAPFAQHRCLLPASYYFEWRQEDNKKIKYRLFSPALPILYLAGIARAGNEGELPRFVILTRPAAAGITFVHDRMPLIVPREAQDAWLHGSINEAASVMDAAIERIDAVPA